MTNMFSDRVIKRLFTSLLVIAFTIIYILIQDEGQCQIIINEIVKRVL